MSPAQLQKCEDSVKSLLDTVHKTNVRVARKMRYNVEWRELLDRVESQLRKIHGRFAYVKAWKKRKANKL